MSRRYFALGALTVPLLVLGTRTASARVDPCVAALGKAGGSQVELLNAFNPAAVNPANVTALNAKGVYLVRGDKGTDYVVRTPAKGVNLTFEGFAADIMANAPNGASPLTRQLTPTEAKAVAAAIRQSPLKAGEKPSATTGKASVALFLPVTTGEQHLNRLKVSGFLRDWLLEFAQAGDGIAPLDRIKLRSRLSVLLEEGSKEEKQSLLEDLQKMSPRFKGVQLAQFDAKVVELIGEGKPSEIASLVALAEQNLPEGLKKQLADYWALCTVLGIKDFHRGNWLIHGDRVIIIDVAEPSKDFLTGKTTLDFENGFFPYRNGLKPPDMTRLMLKSVTPEMKAYLLSLSAEQIAEFGKKHGLEVKPEMIEGVRARARLVADGG